MLANGTAAAPGLSLTAEGGSSSSGNLPSGATAGITIGAVLGVLAAAYIVYRRAKRLRGHRYRSVEITMAKENPQLPALELRDPSPKPAYSETLFCPLRQNFGSLLWLNPPQHLIMRAPGREYRGVPLRNAGVGDYDPWVTRQQEDMSVGAASRQVEHLKAVQVRYPEIPRNHMQRPSTDGRLLSKSARLASWQATPAGTSYLAKRVRWQRYRRGGTARAAEPPLIIRPLESR